MGTEQVGAVRHAVMIGARVRGGIYCGLADLSNHSWTVPGDIFREFSFGQGQKYDLVPGELQSAEPEWVWEGNYFTSEPRVVSCTATVTAGGQVLGTGTAEARADVFPPYFEGDQKRGVHSGQLAVNSTVSPPHVIVTSRDTNYNVAVRFEGKVGTPAWARFSVNPGGWNFVQTTSLGRRFYGVGGTPTHSWVCPQWYLDNAFPYPAAQDAPQPDNQYNFMGGTQWHANVDAGGDADFHYTQDSPHHTVQSGDLSFVIGDDYQMFQLYMPPDNGLGSEYVVLRRFDWTWNASATKPASGWASTTLGTVTPQTGENFTIHPFLTGTATN